MIDVAVVDAGGSNLGSVRYMLERLGVQARLVRDADELRGAARTILPGVGAAAPAMRLLQERGLDVALRTLAMPLLGICLGMQLLYQSSEEGAVDCLGLLPGHVRKLKQEVGIRVPHMGWNALQPLAESPLLADVSPTARVYFVHGYAAPVTGDCIAACRHGERFAAIVQRGLVAGMQFHPERSGAIGARLLRNFIEGPGP